MHCLECLTTKDLVARRWMCRKCYNLKAKLKARKDAEDTKAGIINLGSKQCSGCRCQIKQGLTYCPACTSCAGSYTKNGKLHYNQISIDDKIDIIEFVRRIKLKRFMVDLIEICWIIEYYQMTHKLIYKYDTKSSGSQVQEMWLDLLIWVDKQMNPKNTYKPINRLDEYKRLSK